MTLLRPSPQPPDQHHAKTMLFCPTCDHQNPTDGDWVADDRVERRRLLCPRCGDAVVDDPEF
ncbi:hypothetical protein [Haloarcula sp. JP-L23]|uniref:hypothetical protein n=1 Tax=Haloarcula sp. JP-L23 TaxID=2716717 RepID=UPI00140F025D|nr:hypothetical protein G9465_20275 [Haloarcula sp. JP-L23]